MGDETTLLARLAEQPEAAGLLLDVDGTLAPIVDRPEAAAVPEDTRTVLHGLAGRYALVACVSGRTAAVASLRKVERRAVELGLRARWGRKVLAVLPPVDANKGTAVRALLSARGLRLSLYAGDASTDLEAFPGLYGLDLAVRVAVVSDEGPNQLGREADVIVGGTRELADLLRTL